MTEFSTVGPAYQMTAGGDGNLWIASGGIGRLTPDGQFTDFPVPPAANGYYSVVDVALGPDGAVWFADADGERIGRMTPAGDITLYPIHMGLTPIEPYAIALGPDGNLWFADQEHDVIGRVTPAGVVTTFTVQGSQPNDLVAGPDGNVWFGGNGVGRISTTGQATIVAPNAFAFHLAAGRDGNIWFTDFSAITRLTPSGELTRFETGSDAVYDLVYGRDGRVWFTDNAHNEIGRLTVPGHREPIERVDNTRRPRTPAPRP
jgi:virginiamycin B lyase